MSKTLDDLLQAPLRRTYRGGRSKNFGFDPDEAIQLWRSGKFTTIQALADSLGVDRPRVSRLLHARGAIK